MNDSEYVLGIDFGTYNSAAAVLYPDGRIVPVPGDDSAAANAGEMTKPFPSVVVYDDDGNAIAAGAKAKATARDEPHRAIWGVKRLLGRTYHEVIADGEDERILPDIEPDPENGRVLISIGDHELKPEAVGAELIKLMKARAELMTGVRLTRAMVSTPAYFDGPRIGAIIETVKLAGFSRVNTIPEPVAAALTYQIVITPSPVRVLVFDLGAGTLDVTAGLMRRTGAEAAGLNFEILCTTGDARLGGLDMDYKLARRLAETAQITAPDEELSYRLRQAAERAKVQLTYEPEVTVALPLGEQVRHITLTRFDLTRALRASPRDLLEACRIQVQAALDGAGWAAAEVELVFLVGGPTLMPSIRDLIREIFRKNARVSMQLDKMLGGVLPIDPMMAVAIGAATAPNAALINRHPYGYGIEDVFIEPVIGEQAAWEVHEAKILLPRNSVFPTKSVTFMPHIPYIKAHGIYAIGIIEQVPEAEAAASGLEARPYRFLGSLNLAVSRNGNLQVTVTMALTKDGELEITLHNETGAEIAAYTGIKGLYRNPVDLPNRRRIPWPQMDHWSVVFEEKKAGAVLERAKAFAEFLARHALNNPTDDRELLDGMSQLARAVERWGSDLERNVNELFNIQSGIIHRAAELKWVGDMIWRKFEDELVQARSACFTFKAKAS